MTNSVIALTEALATLAPTRPDARWLAMSNVLARAAQGLTLPEKRLIALGLANTDSRDKGLLARSMGCGWKLTITAQEYARVFQVEDHTAYEQIKSAADAIFQREVRIEGKGPHGKLVTKRLRWISGAVYLPGAGAVEMNFTPEIAPQLLGLASQFTQYQLTHASAFQSAYTWRVFELLKSWQDRGGCTMSIEDFWHSIEAAPSARKDFTQLRLRVLEPSIKEINQKTPFDADWEAVKTGLRKVTALKFMFRAKAQASLDLEPRIA